jgi:hypothetical protein
MPFSHRKKRSVAKTDRVTKTGSGQTQEIRRIMSTRCYNYDCNAQLGSNATINSTIPGTWHQPFQKAAASYAEQRIYNELAIQALEHENHPIAQQVHENAMPLCSPTVRSGQSN